MQPPDNFNEVLDLHARYLKRLFDDHARFSDLRRANKACVTIRLACSMLRFNMHIFATAPKQMLQLRCMLIQTEALYESALEIRHLLAIAKIEEIEEILDN
jgi:hypothetical protein